jgi:hypothetical protein
LSLSLRRRGDEKPPAAGAAGVGGAGGEVRVGSGGLAPDFTRSKPNARSRSNRRFTLASASGLTGGFGAVHGKTLKRIRGGVNCLDEIKPLNRHSREKRNHGLFYSIAQFCDFNRPSLSISDLRYEFKKRRGGVREG